MLPEAAFPFTIQDRTPTQPAPGDQAELTLALTSDLHGSLHGGSSRKPRGLLHLAAPLKRLRQQHPDLILLDGGDTLQGGLTNAYLRTHPHPTLPIITLMNALGYSATVLGNHDLEPPSKLLQQALRQSHFPWLGANVVSASSGQRLLPPYRVFERQGVRMGVVGLTTPGIPLWVDPEQRAGLNFQDLLESLKPWVTVLHEREKVDVLLALLHSGERTDYDRWPALAEGLPDPNAAGLVADTVAGVDVVVSGHAHRIFPRRPTTRLTQFRHPLVSPGSLAQGLMVLHLTLHEQHQRWQLTQVQAHWEPAASHPDPMLQALVQEEQARAQAWADAETAWRFREVPQAQQLNECGARLQHLAVVEALGGTASLLPATWFGFRLPQKDLHQPVRRRHLLRWIRYDNTLVQAQQTRHQLEIWQQPFQRWKAGKSVRGSTVLSPQGLEEVPPEGTTVWLTNYHWNGGGGLGARTLRHPSQVQRQDQTLLRERVFAFLQQPRRNLPAACSFLEPQLP